MSDNRTPESRSALMSRIGPRNTSPELTVRRWLHGAGYRFRIHRRDLPGTPDIVLPRLRIAIFVHGCFWHAHGCSKGRPPKSRPEYWLPKLARNRERDAEKRTALEAAGWYVIVVWQCEAGKAETLDERLAPELDKVEKFRSTMDQLRCKRTVNMVTGTA